VHKGYFFYYHILRKDLLSKYVVFLFSDLPRLDRFRFSARSDHERFLFSDRLLWTWWMLTELLFAQIVRFRRCDTYQADHLSTQPNFMLETEITGRVVYEPLYNLYFAWFRGLYSNLADTSFRRITPLPTSSFTFGPILTRLVARVEYFTYLRPKFRLYFRRSVQLMIYWSDFTFCNFFPPALTAAGADVATRWQLVGSGSALLFPALLRGLRLFQRLDPAESFRRRRFRPRHRLVH